MSTLADTTPMEASQFVIACDGWQQFADSLYPSLERGTLFLPGSEPPPLAATLLLRVRLPEGHVVCLPVVVTATSTAGPPASDGAGCTVQLGPISAVEREGIRQLLAFGRARRDGRRSEASFASFLLAQAPLLSPCQLGHALTQLVPTTARPSQPVPSRPRRETTSHSGVRPLAPPSTVSSVPPPVDSVRPGQDATAPRPAWHSTREPEVLRQALKHLSHRRYGEAIDLLRQLAKADRRDLDAYKWYFVAKARQAVALDDHDRAATAYERVLRLDEHFREARDHLRKHARRRRLSAIPFSKFFSK